MSLFTSLSQTYSNPTPNKKKTKTKTRFAYDPEKPPRHRLSLTALPHSGSGGDGKRAIQFGAEDVGTLCGMLGADGGGGGYSGGGTGADGSGASGNNAVRRHAGDLGAGAGTGGAIVRLPKAVAMFASRACRHSIMIGTALSKVEMEKIVLKMFEVEQPWNCPHGRPTMRHVAGLLGDLLEDVELTE